MPNNQYDRQHDRMDDQGQERHGILPTADPVGFPPLPAYPTTETTDKQAAQNLADMQEAGFSQQEAETLQGYLNESERSAIERMEQERQQKQAAAVQQRRPWPTELPQAAQAAMEENLAITRQSLICAKTALAVLTPRHTPLFDKQLRDLWQNASWLLEDLAALYGQRLWVGQLPPLDTTIQPSMVAEKR